MTHHSKIIKGTSGDDTLRGSEAAEILRGLAGDDRLLGNGGDDQLRGGSGNDQLLGGDGNDRLSGGAGSDRLNGGNGEDRLSGGLGDDNLIGGAGADRLSGGDGDDRLSGGAGDDRFVGGAGNNELLGGGGYDIAGYNTAQANGPVTFKYSFFQREEDSPRGPVMQTRAGFQVVRSDGGIDTLTSIEQVNGVAHQANTVDFSARQIVDGGRGGFRGFLQAPSVTVNLAEGKLKLGEDQSVGSSLPGEQFLQAVTPKTVQLRRFVNVVGSAGEDLITGNGAANRLEGGGDDDVLLGGGGDDTLIGGSRNDTLTGGRGRDKFVLTEVTQFIRSGPDVVVFRLAGGSADTITDFERGDQIQLRQADNFDGTGFGDLALGTIGAEQFAVEGQDEITEATKLIYNSSNGALFYKPNEPVRGPGSPVTFLERVQVATLSGAPNLQAQDVVVI